MIYAHLSQFKGFLKSSPCFDQDLPYYKPNFYNKFFYLFISSNVKQYFMEALYFYQNYKRLKKFIKILVCSNAKKIKNI